MSEGFIVLVVDDDPDIRETLGELIEAEGFSVATAPDGRAALETIRAGVRPSFIVLDLMMPTMNGWDVLRAIRADRSLADVPVAVISASGARTLPPGATYFLRKPIDLDDFLEILRVAQTRVRPRRERYVTGSTEIARRPTLT